MGCELPTVFAPGVLAAKIRGRVSLISRVVTRRRRKSGICPRGLGLSPRLARPD